MAVSKQQAAINKAKADYDKAKKAGNRSAMDAAHADADKARGYTTTADGSQKAPASNGGGGDAKPTTSSYNVTTQNGITAAQNMVPGTSFTNSDGHTWSKNLDGTITVTTPSGAKVPLTINGQSYSSTQDRTVDLMNDTTVTRPEVLTGDQLAKMYGVTYDFHTLNNMLQDAAEAKYKTGTAEAAQMENKLYDQSYGLQKDIISALKGGMGTVNQGASKGTFDSNQLLSLLGYQQQVGDVATTLTQDRQQLANTYAEDKALASQTALTNANKAGIDLGNLATMFDSNNTQFGVGAMDALARIAQSKADQQIALTNASAAKSSGGYTNYGGGTANTNATYKDMPSIVRERDYATFNYLMRQAGASDKEVQDTWDRLVKEATGSVEEFGSGSFQMLQQYDKAVSETARPSVLDYFKKRAGQ